MAPRFPLNVPSRLAPGTYHFPGGKKLIVLPPITIEGQVPKGTTLPTPVPIPRPPTKPQQPPIWWKPEKPKLPSPPLPPRPPILTPPPVWKPKPAPMPPRPTPPPVWKPKPAPMPPRPTPPPVWKPKPINKSGRYWDWVRSDLRADLRSRGISGSEWFWNDSQNTMKVLGLLVKLESMDIWPFVGKITKVWFGPSVYGMNFEPTNRTALLAQLNNNRGLIKSVGSGSSKWHFRDLSSVNSLHIHGDGDWEAHIDTFHAYANPILHGLIDYLPGKIQNWLRK